MAQLLDGLTGAAVTGASISTAFPGLRSRTASGGFVGLIGDPSRVLPGLATTSYDVDLVVEADGYAPRHEHVAFAVQPGFPESFVAADLGRLSLRRSPVALRAGTYELDPTNRPVALGGATVTVNGWWRTVDELGGPPAAGTIVGVGPGLSAARPSGSGIDVPALSMPAEAPRSLVAAVRPGDTRLQLTSAGALAAGDLVGLDLADPDRAERVEVVAVDGPADLLSPAQVDLRFPLASSHAEASPVRRIVAPGAAPPLVVLAEPALEGDRTLALSSLGGLGSGSVVRVAGGGVAPEYRVVDLYDLTTDGEGFARFPPITGLAALAVSAASGGLGAHARVTLTQPSPAVDLTLT